MPVPCVPRAWGCVAMLSSQHDVYSYWVGFFKNGTPQRVLAGSTETERETLTPLMAIDVHVLLTATNPINLP